MLGSYGMIHLETYEAEDRKANSVWWKSEPPPDGLLNPTNYVERMVGDKVSLPLCPIVAACGVAVPQLSGRGLGHTGGTLDKLAAIPGYFFEHEQVKLSAHLNATGCFIIGQSADIAPADKKLTISVEKIATRVPLCGEKRPPECSAVSSAMMEIRKM